MSRIFDADEATSVGMVPWTVEEVLQPGQVRSAPPPVQPQLAAAAPRQDLEAAIAELQTRHRRELDEAVGLPYEFRFSAETPEWMRADPRTLYPTFYWPAGRGHRMIRGWYGIGATVEAIRKTE